MNRKDFILKLIGGVANYVLEKEPGRMVISLHQEEDGLHLCIMDDNEHTDEEIAAMEKALNSRKRPELSGYYGAMTGRDMLGSARLDLLGWQVKHADVSRQDGGVMINLWLGGEKFQSEKFTIPEKESD